MATKAELEVELAALRRELKQRDDEDKSPSSDVVAAKPADQSPDANGIQQLLDEHGINAETVDAFKDNLLEELTELQKDKPLVILVAALALGIVIGRAFK